MVRYRITTIHLTSKRFLADAKMAERVGFEPTRAFTLPVFKFYRMGSSAHRQLRW